MSYNLARPYSRSFKGPIDTSLVFSTTAARTGWLSTTEGIAIGYSGMIVSDLQTNKAYMLSSSNTWIEITSSNAVETTGNQNISGVKTFVNRPIFNSGISVSGVTASSNSGLFLPVFTGNPSSSQQTLFTRTPSQFKSDIGLGNVENTALSTYSRNGIDSRTSFPPSTHDITSHTGTNWQVFYTNGSNQVVGLGLGSNGQVLKSNGTTAAPSWQADNDTTYTHPTQTAISESEANGKVLSAISVNTLGHVTSVGTKTLAEVDIPTLAQSKITNLSTDLSNKVAKSGDTMTGFLTLHADPATDLHAATKRYVDSVQQGLDVKQSVRAATTENLSNDAYTQTDELYGSSNFALVLDNVSLVSGDRFLVKNADSGGEIFGIWKLEDPGSASTPFIAVRPNDFNTNDKVSAGAFTFIEEGTINGDTGWVLTSNDPLNVFSDQVWSQFSAAGQIYDGSGLYKTGNTISVGEGDGIFVSTDSVAVNATVLRTSGVQTVTGDKDFGNNLLIKPIKNASSAFFPAFAVEPSGASQRLTYMTKSELVTALSFETPELGNSFVNTTGNQTISGIKTFNHTTTYFNGYMPVGGGNFVDGTISLNNSQANAIRFNGSGISDRPTATSISIVSGTKIVLKPAAQGVYPASIGIGNNKIWHTAPSTSFVYEWYAGPNKVASLDGQGTFFAGSLSGYNLYLNNVQVVSTAAELNLLASSSDKDILIGSGANFVKQNFITALSGAIISQSGLNISNTASNLIINHHLSSATSTSNSNPNVVQNILLDNYGHITGVSNVNLDDIYLTSSDLNTQISFVSGIGSYYNSSNSGLTVFHSVGNKTAGTYGGNGIKSIQLDSYGHIYDISTETYVASGDLCTAISSCTIDGGTY